MIGGLGGGLDLESYPLGGGGNFKIILFRDRQRNHTVTLLGF